MPSAAVSAGMVRREGGRRQPLGEYAVSYGFWRSVDSAFGRRTPVYLMHSGGKRHEPNRVVILAKVHNSAIVGVRKHGAMRASGMTRRRHRRIRRPCC